MAPGSLKKPPKAYEYDKGSCFYQPKRMSSLNHGEILKLMLFQKNIILKRKLLLWFFTIKYIQQKTLNILTRKRGCLTSDICCLALPVKINCVFYNLNCTINPGSKKRRRMGNLFPSWCSGIGA